MTSHANGRDSVSLPDVAEIVIEEVKPEMVSIPFSGMYPSMMIAPSWRRQKPFTSQAKRNKPQAEAQNVTFVFG
jgi:hypothetical protein